MSAARLYTCSQPTDAAAQLESVRRSVCANTLQNSFVGERHCPEAGFIEERGGKRETPRTQKKKYEEKSHNPTRQNYVLKTERGCGTNTKCASRKAVLMIRAVVEQTRLKLGQRGGSCDAKVMLTTASRRGTTLRLNTIKRSAQSTPTRKYCKLTRGSWPW